MSGLLVLAWWIAIYIAGGVLTSLAVVVICWSEVPAEQSGSARKQFPSMLKVFALWPAVVLMAALFAIIMVAQKCTK
jgi:hypothetical protein